jgi:hypothetical protein
VEVEIQGYYGGVMTGSPSQNIFIDRGGHAEVTDMCAIVAKFSQAACGLARHALVQE